MIREDHLPPSPASAMTRREMELWNLALASAIKAVEAWERDARDPQDLLDAIMDLKIYIRTL